MSVTKTKTLKAERKANKGTWLERRSNNWGCSSLGSFVTIDVVTTSRKAEEERKEGRKK
jgi:hypothetical protein